MVPEICRVASAQDCIFGLQEALGPPFLCALLPFVSWGSAPLARLPLSQPRLPGAILRSADLPAPLEGSHVVAPARPPEEWPLPGPRRSEAKGVALRRSVTARAGDFLGPCFFKPLLQELGSARFGCFLLNSATDLKMFFLISALPYWSEILPYNLVK